MDAIREIYLQFDYVRYTDLYFVSPIAANDLHRTNETADSDAGVGEAVGDMEKGVDPNLWREGGEGGLFCGRGGGFHKFVSVKDDLLHRILVAEVVDCSRY